MKKGNLSKIFKLFTCVFIIALFSTGSSFAQELKTKTEVMEKELAAEKEKKDAEMALKAPYASLGGLSSDLSIRQSDRLRIYTYPSMDPDNPGQKEGTYYVDNQGYIFIPPIGKVKAVDMTIPELENFLTNKIKQDIAKTPLIFVSKETTVSSQIGWWKEAFVRPIPVFGEVGGPGNVYPLREDVTLLEVISDRGSFKPSANLREIKVVRVVDKKEKVFTVRADDIIEGKAPDIVLERGDILFVPEEKQKILYVFGEVNRPGPISIRDFFEDKLKMVDTISLAGGFTIWANQNKVKLIRHVEGKRTVSYIKVKKVIEGEAEDVILQPGDVIIVPASWW